MSIRIKYGFFVPKGHQAAMDHLRDVQTMRRWTDLRARGWTRNELAMEHADRIFFGQPINKGRCGSAR